jgi:hypothetical protein
MPTNDFIEFKKERDLGTMITDSFKFLRLEWKPFFTAIIKISLVPILLAITSVIFFSLTFSDVFSSILTFDTTGSFDTPTVDYGMFFIVSMTSLIFYLIAYVMVSASAMYYVKSYVENQGKVNYDYVKQMTFNKFWSFTALYIVTGIIVFVGILFCFLPGIYFGIVLSLSSCLLVFTKKSAMDAIGDAFTFIKGHWWDSFGILIVVSLIVSVLNYITQVPAMIYQLIQIGTSAFGGDPTEMMNLFKDPIYLVLLTFSYFIQFLFYTITLLVTIFIFFDINEQKNNSGAIDKIDAIGS